MSGPSISLLSKLLLLLCLFAGCSAKTEAPLLIATAASNKAAFSALIEDFTAQTGIDAELVVAASGQLTAQIKAGAPYDVFISADKSYPLSLAKADMLADTLITFAYGSLVLWSTNEALAIDLDNLSEEGHLAIANPKVAPFGRLADSLLQLRPDYHERIAPRLVLGESIAQVNQFVSSGAADFGITARTTLTKGTTGQWVDFHPNCNIPQTICLIKGQNTVGGQAFLKFLSTKPARLKLKSYGYQLR